MPARGHVEKLETEDDLKHLGTNFSFVPLDQIKSSLLLPGFKLPFVPKFDEEKRLLGKFLKYLSRSMIRFSLNFTINTVKNLN